MYLLWEVCTVMWEMFATTVELLCVMFLGYKSKNHFVVRLNGKIFWEHPCT